MDKLMKLVVAVQLRMMGAFDEKEKITISLVLSAGPSVTIPRKAGGISRN